MLPIQCLSLIIWLNATINSASPYTTLTYFFLRLILYFSFRSNRQHLGTSSRIYRTRCWPLDRQLVSGTWFTTRVQTYDSSRPVGTQVSLYTGWIQPHLEYRWSDFTSCSPDCRTLRKFCGVKPVFHIMEHIRRVKESLRNGSRLGRKGERLMLVEFVRWVFQVACTAYLCLFTRLIFIIVCKLLDNLYLEVSLDSSHLNHSWLHIYWVSKVLPEKQNAYLNLIIAIWIVIL